MRVLNTSITLGTILTTSLLIIFPSAALSEVVFSNPVAGKSFTGGTAFEVAWKDDGNVPKTTTTGPYTLDLCVGSNDQIYPLTTLGVPGETFGTAAGTTTVTVPSSIGGNGPYYFLRMTWTETATGGTVINFSDRFTMRGMLGVFTTAQQAANSAGDTDRPEAVHPQEAAPVPDAAQGDFAVPYSEQSGPVRYAPMQPRPGSKITAKNMKRQYPTSAYTVYTTKGPKPAASTTVTAPRTYPLTTVVNDASPAPMPDEDMQRFLNRWKD